jgi:NDP-sugar pyrophosphorylase family protein
MLAHAVSLDSQIEFVVLAGGLGTRIRPTLGELPKTLAPVAGRPFITYLLDQIADTGVSKVTIAAGHGGNQVMAVLGSRYESLRIRYSIESAPLGTAGALRYAAEQSTAPHIVAMNGDSYIAANLSEFWMWHCQTRATASMILTSLDDTSRFGTVTFDASGRVNEFIEKRAGAAVGWINAGVYALPRTWIMELPAQKQVSLEYDAMPIWVARGVLTYRLSAPFIDIGTPETLEKAQNFMRTVAEAI